MKRTVVSLSDEDKEWLDRRAEREGVPMTELVRRAVSMLREKLQREDPPFDELLEETSGTWPQGEGVDYQRRIRDEW